MRISPDFILRDVAGVSVVIPTREAARRFSGLISLNETGTFLFTLLQEERTEQELVEKMLETYDIDATVAAEDVAEFIANLQEHQMLAE